MKPLKLPNEDKDTNDFLNRLENVENKKCIEKEETDIDNEKHRKCEELRFERIKKLTEIMGYNSALEHQYDEITDFELAWELECALGVPPEVRYQRRKEYWNHHESSWTQRGINGYDGQGCNGFTGCVPECRYFAETGTITDDEVIREHEEHNKKERETIAERNRKYGLNDNDSDEIKKQKWEEIHEVEIRIMNLKGEYYQKTQHVGPNPEVVKAIEDAVWAEFCNKIKERQQQSQQQQQ